MKIGLLTELEAVNLMLSVIGEAPVNSIDNNGVIDAVMAKQILTDTNRSVQSQGWHWNTDKGYEIAPSFPLPGELILPANTLQVDTVYPNGDMDLVQRGLRFYDRRKHTYTFEESVKVDIVRLLDFEELPQAARTYIAIRAARIFQDRVVGSETLSGFNDKDETRALVALRQAQSDTEGNNVLTGNWSVARILRRQ